MRLRSITAIVAALGLTTGVGSCSSAPEVDPLAVTNSATITDIEDNTGTGYYTVSSAKLTTNGLGTELELGFTILNTNGIKFSPVSVITFADGTVLTCEADDLRRVPSLVKTTDSWDFACDAAEFPANTKGATVVVVDDYNN